MRYLEPELLEVLASRYVLGTLHARPRRRFARLMKMHAPVEQAVRHWERRLLPLAAAVPPVKPPAHAWQALDARINDRPPAMARLRNWFVELGAAARPLRWALATQALAVVGLALALALTRAPEYQTFSTPPTARGDLRLLFVESTTEKEMRTVLHAIGGTIVHGPGAIGVYTVALTEPAKLETALAMLRRHPRVRFAEPILN